MKTFYGLSLIFHVMHDFSDVNNQRKVLFIPSHIHPFGQTNQEARIGAGPPAGRYNNNHPHYYYRDVKRE